jgi:hypothetical protein
MSPSHGIVIDTSSTAFLERPGVLNWIALKEDNEGEANSVADGEHKHCDDLKSQRSCPEYAI